MAKQRFKYIRKSLNDHNHQDPTQGLFDLGFIYNFGETPFGNGDNYLLRVDSEDSQSTILKELNKLEGFSFSFIGSPAVLNRCNNNIEHIEGEEFTMEGDDIIDNRTLDELV